MQGDTGDVRYASPSGAVDGAVGRWTAEGPTVLWVSERDSGASYVDDLHLVTPAGDDAVVYTAPTGADVSEPSLSQDGRSVLFVLDTDDASAILIADTSTLATHTVRSSASTDYYGPSFSPDATYLSWAQQSARGSDVVVTRVATGTATVVEHGSDVDFSDTAWSPDGTRLALERDEDAGPALQVLDLASGNSRVLLHGSTGSDGVVHGYAEPAWASDSDLLHLSKVSITRSGADATPITTSASSGGESAVVAPGYVGLPSVAGPVRADSTPPGVTLTGATSGASAHLDYATSDTDVAEFIVTRTTGEPADTPTVDTEVGRTRTRSFDVPLPRPGTSYGLSVFARDWSGNLSAAAKTTVTSAGDSTLSVSTPAARTHWRNGVKLTGTLAGGAEPLDRQKVVLYVRRAMTSTAVPVSSTTTDARGAYTLTYTPPWTAEYQVRYAGSSAAYPVDSAKRTVAVLPAINFNTPALDVKVGRALVTSGNVGPGHPGQVVSIQRKLNGVWRTIASGRLTSTSTYRVSVTPTTRGTWELRAYKPADSDHAATSSSGRTLRVS